MGFRVADVVVHDGATCRKTIEDYLLNRSRDGLIAILVWLASIADAYNRVLADFPFWKSCCICMVGLYVEKPRRRYGVFTPSKI